MISSWRLNRRDFFVGLLSWLGIAFPFNFFQPVKGECSQNAGKRSKLVTVFHPGATDGTGGKDNDNLRDDVVRRMVHEGIKAFAGKSNLTEAWAQIIPDPNKKIAIKVNCQIRGIYTKAKVVAPITEGLLLSGVPPDNIIIYDMRDKAFSLAGFSRNLGPGIKVGTVDDFGGYSRFFFDRLANLLTGGFPNSFINLISQGLQNVDSWAVKKIGGNLLPAHQGKLDCEYLINVPVLKALDGYAGVTLSMKNHYGSIGNPHDHHDGIMDYIPYLNNLPQIRDKTRLIILDAIFMQSKWTGGRNQEHVSVLNKILISDDPVAIDFTGWQLIEKNRKTQGLPAVIPQPEYIAKAAALGLGSNDPNTIQNMIINLGEDAQTGSAIRYPQQMKQRGQIS